MIKAQTKKKERKKKKEKKNKGKWVKNKLTYKLNIQKFSNFFYRIVNQ
jgi:hypothetical protein